MVRIPLCVRLSYDGVGVEFAGQTVFEGLGFAGFFRFFRERPGGRSRCRFAAICAALCHFIAPLDSAL